MQYQLFLLLGGCLLISRLGTAGSGSQDHIYDGGTKEKEY